MERSNHALYRRASVAIVLVAGTSCTTKGTAVGVAESPTSQEGEPVMFVWKSDVDNPVEGKISGTLPDGVHYSGRYFEVMKDVPAEAYSPAWEGWATPYWPDWDAEWATMPPPPVDFPTFVAIYSGRVIANLVSDDGEKRLRCRFSLEIPEEGLAGGGVGECQGSGGEEIDHVVARTP